MFVRFHFKYVEVLFHSIQDYWKHSLRYHLKIQLTRCFIWTVIFLQCNAEQISWNIDPGQSGWDVMGSPFSNGLARVTAFPQAPLELGQ